MVSLSEFQSISRERHFAAIAHHEAAHAVHGLSIGWRLRGKGVRLFSAAGGLAQFVPSDCYTNHQFCINKLIGHAAECRLGYKAAYNETEVREILDRMKDLLAEKESADSDIFEINDEYSTLQMIQNTSPGTPIEDIIEYFLSFEEMAIEAANEHWADIERVAHALLAKIPPEQELFKPFPRGQIWLKHSEVKKLMAVPACGN
jgi:hypothetical protein